MSNGASTCMIRADSDAEMLVYVRSRHYPLRRQTGV
jgi:hypothetical protein